LGQGSVENQILLFLIMFSLIHISILSVFLTIIHFY
jgi:hypothetical protein